jgi:signal transduction histidine kinase
VRGLSGIEAGAAPLTQVLGSARIDASTALRWLLVFAAYGILFALLRSLAISWTTHGLFSLWFPAAGLRFAFLWTVGGRRAPAAALAEFAASFASRTVEIGDPAFLSIAGIIGPCLVYGGVILTVESQARARGAKAFDPLPFAIAAVVSPMVACIAALPWAVPLASEAGSLDAHLLFSALLVFTLGDLLGILVVAPPLLWLASAVQSGDWRTFVRVPRAARATELVAILVCAAALVWLLQRLGDGLVLAPVLLAACWCGLRGGRAAAWLAIIATALIVLPLTSGGVGDAERVQVHMQLACIAVGAYLAGSYADAQARAIREIGRRDRLLFQAERLKTLRAMSVAVIHEVSQPLSTIAIEARALRQASEAGQPDLDDIRDIAALIDRKTHDLAELVRRLRGFGGGGDAVSTSQALGPLVAEVVTLAAPEAKAAGVSIECIGGPQLCVTVNEVEIRQAMLNLLRNAVAASAAGGLVTVGWSETGSSACLSIHNQVAARRAAGGGMGIGLIIARAIAHAHGGRIVAETLPQGGVRCTLKLPLDQDPEQ